eukprot:scaffold7092_cov262-Pinguiococcus_pyrenoidosus.AAC.35
MIDENQTLYADEHLEEGRLLLVPAWPGPRPDERQADFAIVVEIRIEAYSPPACRQELHLRWLVRIVHGQVDVELEKAVLVRRVLGTNDERLQEAEVLVIAPQEDGRSRFNGQATTSQVCQFRAYPAHAPDHARVVPTAARVGVVGRGERVHAFQILYRLEAQGPHLGQVALEIRIVFQGHHLRLVAAVFPLRPLALESAVHRVGIAQLRHGALAEGSLDVLDPLARVSHEVPRVRLSIYAALTERVLTHRACQLEQAGHGVHDAHGAVCAGRHAGLQLVVDFDHAQ